MCRSARDAYVYTISNLHVDGCNVQFVPATLSLSLSLHRAPKFNFETSLADATALPSRYESKHKVSWESELRQYGLSL